MRIGIDARELARLHLESLGRIVLRQLPYIEADEVVLYSDDPVSPKVISLASHVSNIVRGRTNTGGIDALRYLRWVSAQARSSGVDVLYQINHFSPFRIPGVKQITVIHDLYPLERVEPVSGITRFEYRSLLRRSLEVSDAVVAVSEVTRETIIKHFGAKYSNKLYVNPNGIEKPSVASCPAFDSRLSDGFLLVLGRVCFWKGYDRILSLYPRIKELTGLKLVFAGRADSEVAQHRLLSAMERDCDIIWLDYVSDEQREWLYLNCEALLYASRYDGFGLPPLEAAIRGTKALVNDIPVLREVTEGKGRYIPYYENDSVAVAKIIGELRDSNRTPENLVRQVALNTTWEKNARRLNEIVCKVYRG